MRRIVMLALLLSFVAACVPPQHVQSAPAQPAPVVVPEPVLSTPAPLENASPLVPPPQLPLDLSDNLDESIKDLQYST